MTSSNGNIFRVTGPLCGEFNGPGEFPTQRPVTRSLDVFFDLRLNTRLSKEPRGWWFEKPSWSLRRQCNEMHNKTEAICVYHAMRRSHLFKRKSDDNCLKMMDINLSKWAQTWNHPSYSCLAVACGSCYRAMLRLDKNQRQFTITLLISNTFEMCFSFQFMQQCEWYVSPKQTFVAL